MNYYKQVILQHGTAPNAVWYHYYYSKGAGLMFLYMLLVDAKAVKRQEVENRREDHRCCKCRQGRPREQADGQRDGDETHGRRGTDERVSTPERAHAHQQAHLEECPPCREYLAQFRAVIAAAGRETAEELPEGERRVLRSAFQAWAAGR